MKKLFGLLLPFAITSSLSSCCGDEYIFDRIHLDKYVEVTEQPTQMNDGNAVYFDMSDGMNAAYADDNSKAVLQGIVNSIAGKADCFGLANNQISPIEKSHTELYNYLLNSKSYSQISAPVQKTLETIVEKNQPALLLTDYEEYNNGRIQKAAYAKEAFTAWLKKGHKITFYKWNFTENGKEKMMFLTVFDDNSDSLGNLIKNAVENLENYVLGGKDFAFPVSTNYVYQVDNDGTKKNLSVNQGGNYHNSKGKDAVTVVLEKGDAQSYKSYCEPLAVAGGKGAYTPLNTEVGALAEYYPFCEPWENILTNSKSQSSEEIPEKDRFTHLFSNLYINLNAQQGYKISGIEARVFDITKAMQMCAEDTVKVKAVQDCEAEQVFDFLTATTQKESDLTKVSVDFDQKFKASSKFEGAIYRVDIVISAATEDIDKVKTFFYWDGNPSLATSVEQVLLDTECNPQGHVLYTYYIKNIAY